MRRRIVRAIAIAAGAAALTLLAVAAYWHFVGLGVLRGPTERIVGQALGRELTIGGAIEVDMLAGPTLTAEDVTLGNREGLEEPTMLHIGHLEADLDPVSLAFGPVRIPRLKIRDARVVLEVDARGRPNWTLGRHDADPSAAIALGEVEAAGVELTYRDRLQGRSFVVHVERIVATFDEPGATSGVSFDGAGQLDETEVRLHGRIADLFGFERVELGLEASGPDRAPLARALGLVQPPPGPFRLTAAITTAGGGSSIALDATFPEGAVSARGRMGPLSQPKPLELDIEATGPDLAAALVWTGVDGLPSGGFTAAGRLRWEAAGMTLEGLEVRAGDDRLRVDATVDLGSGASRDLDLAFVGSGPDVARLGGMVGLDLPAEPYALAGRLKSKDGHVTLQDGRGTIGTTTLLASGTIGDPLGLAAAELQVAAEGPDLLSAGRWFEVDLPAQPFRLAGGLGLGMGKLRLDSVSLQTAGHTLVAEGTLELRPGRSGTALELHLTGPDAAWVAPVFGLADLPAEPYEASGRLGVDGVVALDGLAVRIGEQRLGTRGRILLVPGAVGTEVDAWIAGPDASWLGGFVGLPGPPAWPFQATGRVAVRADGYVIEDAKVRLGEVTLEAGGRLGPLPVLTGTELDLALRAPSLSDLAAMVGGPPLPAETVVATGRLVVQDASTYRLEGAAVAIGGNRIALDGRLSTRAGLAGTELAVRAAGPDAAEVERWAVEAGLIELHGVPAWPFAFDGTVRVDEDRYRLQAAAMHLGQHELQVEGTLGRPPGYLGTALTIDARGFDASFPGRLAGLSIPAQPYRMRGAVERHEAGRLRLQQLEIEVGVYRVRADGVLGDPPTLAGTSLDLHASGPDLLPFATGPDPPLIMAQSFEVAARFDGTAERFRLRDLDCRFGESDLAGWLEIDRQGRPRLDGELASRRLDLATMGDAIPGAGPDAPAGAGEVKLDRKARPYVFSADPLPTALLELADGEIRWTAEEVVGTAMHYFDAELHARLGDGVLNVDHIRAVDALGGRFAATLELRPEGDVHRFRARVEMKGVRFDVASVPDDPALWPMIDLHAEVEGVGRSPREIAASADGWGLVVVGPGRVDNRLVSLLGSDVMVETLNLLNPWRSQESYTAFECAVLAGELQSGMLTLGPLAARTDKVSIVGRGRVDLATERLDVLWTAKPRKGVGLGTNVFVSPLLKVGGTLGHPQLEVKPIWAAVNTGAAVATGGLSLLGETLWNRITAGHQVCDAARKKVEKDPRMHAVLHGAPSPGSSGEPTPEHATGQPLASTARGPAPH